MRTNIFKKKYTNLKSRASAGAIRAYRWLDVGWQWQKGFFNLAILRYLVTWFAIVPIIAKLFSGFKLNLKILGGNEINLLSNFSLPFSLKLLWLSSLFFVAALIFYRFFCPWFIKKYNNYADYKKYSHSPRWIIHEALRVLNDKKQLPKLFKQLEDKKYVSKTTSSITNNHAVIEQYQTVAYFTYDSSDYELRMPQLNKDNTLNVLETETREREIFWEIFQRFSSSKKGMRIFIVILLSVSGLLFLYTLFEHIIYGVKSLFQ